MLHKYRKLEIINLIKNQRTTFCISNGRESAKYQGL